MKSSRLIFSFFAAVLFLSGFLVVDNTLGAAQDITVGITVPAAPTSTGGDTGGFPTDDPPSITNISTSTSFTTAVISWNANDDNGISVVVFEYGLSISYGHSQSVTAPYQVNLAGLTENTLYYFRISVTDTGSHNVTYSGTLRTSNVISDTTPPLISGVIVMPGMTTSTITWNTDELSDSQINYGQTASYGSTFSDSNSVLSHTAFILNLLPDTTYHYRIISTDASGNSTSTFDNTFKTEKDNLPPPDVSNFNLSTTTNSIDLSWQNPSLASVPDFEGVKVIRKVGSPSVNYQDGTLIYDGAGQSFSDNGVVKDTNYFYTIFSFDTSANYSPGIYRNGKVPTIIIPVQTEICGNGLDDDGNGMADCADLVCSNLPACAAIPPVTTTPPSTTTPPVEPPYVPPPTTIPSFAKINLSDLIFLFGNRQIAVFPVGDVVFGLPDTTLTLVVPENVLASMPKSIVVKVGNDQHQFVYNSSEKKYYSDFSFPNSGQIQAYLEVDYGSSQFDSVGFKMRSLLWGNVVDDSGGLLTGVEIILSKPDGSRVAMETYGQSNPILTGAGGIFGWIVPDGQYNLIAQKDGYYKYSLSSIRIENHIFNSNIKLVQQPPRLLDVIEPDAPLIKNVGNVAKNLVAQTKAVSEVAVQRIEEVIRNPEVKQATEQVVAPTAITVVAISAIPLISWMDLLPLLRLLFLQPLMLVGWRKRQKWGLVYNSLSKQPVDLAIVRLLSVENNKVVQSKVTDAQGHYIFIVDPGKYRLEVRKNNFVFPSVLLAGFKNDGQKIDVYHGEIIEVNDKGAAVAVNVPLDPAGANKRPSRLVWEKFGRRLQLVLSWVGILVTALSLYISPKWHIGALLGVHLILFFLFRRLAVSPKSKSWGIVNDQINKKPISKVVARLFNSQFNKLVSTQITDSKGRYSFLAGDDKYYVTYEHKEYQPHKTESIDLIGKESDAIAPDVELKKH